MISFLFWNLKRNPVEQIINNLAVRYAIDILMFAECQIPPEKLLAVLNHPKPLYHHLNSGLCSKINIFTRFSPKFFTTLDESDRWTIKKLTLPGVKELLLCVVHHQSKYNWSDPSQAIECLPLTQSINDVEKNAGHQQTLVFGDFNMNPFETGMIATAGFNAVMSRDIARKQKRTVASREYPFFYNPMWNFFGDFEPGPPGTYYFQVSEHVGFHWNVFDQVLLRPDLLPFFEPDNLRIIDADDTCRFLKEGGTPDADKISDHLPIYLQLTL